jgi:hypothetical protein
VLERLVVGLQGRAPVVVGGGGGSGGGSGSGSGGGGVEDQYGVGDVIDVGPAIGTVEAVTLRTTRLRDVNGTVWHLPNGNIERVGNKSQHWSRALLDIEVSYRTDIAHATEVVKRTADALCTEEAYAGLVMGRPRCGASRSSASTASPSGWCSRPGRTSSSRWPGSCGPASSRRSTRGASRSPSPQRSVWHRTSEGDVGDPVVVGADPSRAGGERL